MRSVRNERNDYENISRDEVSSTFRKLKCGKAAGVDGIIAEVISK